MAVLCALFVMQMLLPVAIWLLIRKRRSVQVFYLRAFRSDNSAARLRRLLRVALGGGHRLCGIRQPRARSNPLVSLLLPVVTALRYTGSDYSELEAKSHNWMARLLASYARARFAFVDIRSVTPHVESEIRLTILAFGPDRCVFVTDGSRTEGEWIELLHRASGVPEAAVSHFHLLCYAGDDQADAGEFVAAARALCARIPEGTAGVSDEAVAFARGHVPDSSWDTPAWERDRGMLALGLAASLGAGALLGFAATRIAPVGAGPAAGLCLILAVNGLVLCLYGVGWVRAWRQAGLACAFGGKGGGVGRSALVFSLLLAGTYVLFNACSIRAMGTIDRQGKVALARAEILTLEAALNQYRLQQGDFPSTAKGLPAESTVRLDPWGHPFRYRFPGSDDLQKYDLWSAGPDGIDGTADDVTDR
jgi:general secretion pathway protein G